jgi:hypothetical protein
MFAVRSGAVVVRGGGPSLGGRAPTEGRDVGAMPLGPGRVRLGHRVFATIAVPRSGAAAAQRYDQVVDERR